MKIKRLKDAIVFKDNIIKEQNVELDNVIKEHNVELDSIKKFRRKSEETS